MAEHPGSENEERPFGGAGATPENFSFIIDGELAGMARPGLYHILDDDLAFLKNAGIKTVASLTIKPLDAAVAERFGIAVRHFPIEDFGAPTLAELRECMRVIEDSIRERKPVVVHCGAGYGRTGTILACFLVWRGKDADDAIRTVRGARPFSVETIEQEAIVREYDAFLRKERGGNGK